MRPPFLRSLSTVLIGALLILGVGDANAQAEVAASPVATTSQPPAVAKDSAAGAKAKDGPAAKKTEPDDTAAKTGTADKAKPSEPLTPENRVWIVVAVMLLMGGLFYVLFRWQQQIEQSGYFAGIYTDAVKKVDLIRLAGPTHERWARGDYLKEVFLERSQRGRDWLKSAGHERPSSAALRALAADMDERAVYRIEAAERVLHAVPVVRDGAGRNPYADDWAGSETGNLGRSAPNFAPRGNGSTAEQVTQEDKFKRDLETFSNEAAHWVRKAMAQAWDWYQEDIEDAEDKAERSARLALNVDFSALRGRGPEFVLEFTAVVVIIFAAVILGVLERLSSEQIGTLLAAIAGYVLGKGTSRDRAPATDAAAGAGDRAKNGNLAKEPKPDAMPAAGKPQT